MNGYLIALIVLAIWFVLVYVAHKTKWLERHSMGLMGPMIMWRTRKGREVIERLASRKRLWSLYGQVALWICAAAMLVIMVLLLWEATIVPQVKQAPSPELILGIPGINPVIPLGYGVLALVVAIVVHEVSHGILTRNGGMKVENLGLVFMVVPIGAFVEPDEKALQTTTRSKRSKVFAAGPASNIILAMIMLGLFSGVFMSSVDPTHEGALAVGVVDSSPAEFAGMKPSSVIVSIGGQPISDAAGFDARASPAPGETVQVQYYLKGEISSTSFVDGVVVAYVVDGFAAQQAGIRTGMVLVSINGTNLGNTTQLSDAMAMTRAGQTVPVTVMTYDPSTEGFLVNSSLAQVTLSDKWDYYQQFDKKNNDPSYHGVGYLGAGFLDLGIRAEDVTYYSGTLSSPFEGDRNIDDFARSWLRLIALPFLDLAPIRSPVTDLYHPSGAMAWMPDSAFWILANSVYWIFWLNLMVGLTNVLPAVPLDGGYIFRDGVDYLLSRTARKYTKEQREKVVGSITLAFALTVLALIVWQLVGPAF